MLGGKKRPAQIRILPLMIFMGFMVLTVRVTDLVQGIYLQSNLVHAAGAEKKPNKAQDKAKAQKKASKADAPAEAEMAEEDIVFKKLLDYQPEEIKILSELSDRKVEIEKRGKEVDAKERTLKALEKKLQGYTQTISENKKDTEVDDKTDQARAKKMADRAKIFQTMKPQDASRILSALNIDTSLSILEQMSAMKSAPIIAAMPPEKARVITEKLMAL